MTEAPHYDPRDRVVPCLLALTVILALALLLSSCAPVVIEKVHYQHDTTYIDRLRVDSIYYRDSVYVKDHGDTVWIYKELWRDRWHWERDTVAVVRVDSVAVEREKIVQVEKPLTRWQSLKFALFPWLLGAVLALGLWTIRKPLIKLIKRL